MLVLSRKKNESVVINNDIVVTVIEIRVDKVRLGIVVPKDVPVHRQEVFDALYGHSEDVIPPQSPSPPPAPISSAASGDRSSRRDAWLDRVAAALQSRIGTPVSRELLEQAILDAGAQEFGS